MSAKSQLNRPILYLDTSEPEAVIAIFDNEKIVSEEKWLAGRELSATLSQKHSDILAKLGMSVSDLVGICVFVGPGSFTGLRIGISFANALAFALNIPIYETKIKEELNSNNPKKIALPFYGSEPKITKPKKK